MLKEFKEFALKGNVIDMAVGVIIGGAFQKIVTSLVNDIIMPLITSLTGKVSFDDLVVVLGSSEIKYGSFITTIIDFLIIAFSIFIAIKTFTKLNDRAKQDMKKLAKNQKKEEKKVEEPTIKVCPHCFSEINIKATRCPHCTSELAEENNIKAE